MNQAAFKWEEPEYPVPVRCRVCGRKLTAARIRGIGHGAWLLAAVEAGWRCKGEIPGKKDESKWMTLFLAK